MCPRLLNHFESSRYKNCFKLKKRIFFFYTQIFLLVCNSIKFIFSQSPNSKIDLVKTIKKNFDLLFLNL